MELNLTRLQNAHAQVTGRRETVPPAKSGPRSPNRLIAHKLADAAINIDYCCFATSPVVKHGLLVLRVSNPKKAMKVLNL